MIQKAKETGKVRAIIIYLMSILILCVFYFSADVFATEAYDFPNFSVEDSMEFVEQCNITIPDKLLKSEKLPLFTQQLILQAYYYPNSEFCFNYGETQQYAESIRTAVKAYVDSAAVPMIAGDAPYTLQYSTVMDENGNWVTSGGYYQAKWVNYNCYAYAINRAERTPSYNTTEQYLPGDMSGSGSFSSCDTIEELANIVKDDLIAMGFSNVTLSTSIPEIDSTKELICVRMSDMDFHFMRFDIDTNAWFHKTGKKAVLKYNYTPSNSFVWCNEYSYTTGEYPPTTFYDSEIVFISYSKNWLNTTTNNTASIDIQPCKDILCELNFENAAKYNIQINAAYSVEYEIYNEDFDKLLYGYGAIVNECLSATDNKYYLRVQFESYYALEGVDICIVPHSHKYEECTHVDSASHTGTCACGNTITEDHTYDECVYKDALNHTVICKCGYQTISSHWVKPTSNRYANCVGCGALIDLGGTITPVNPFNIRKVSVNGSYILPNGIAVIVDADEEAYRNGTLVFYDPGDVPVTQ